MSSCKHDFSPDGFCRRCNKTRVSAAFATITAPRPLKADGHDEWRQDRNKRKAARRRLRAAGVM